MYQISGEDKIFAWLSQEPDEGHREAMLAWLPELAADPVAVATARRYRPGVPAYVAGVPGTAAFVDYTVIEQFQTVLVLFVSSLRKEDFGEDEEEG